jgi:hypothetical protein
VQEERTIESTRPPIYNSGHDHAFMTANDAPRCFDHSFHLNGWGEVAWTRKYFDVMVISSS